MTDERVFQLFRETGRPGYLAVLRRRHDARVTRYLITFGVSAEYAGVVWSCIARMDRPNPNVPFVPDMYRVIIDVTGHLRRRVKRVDAILRHPNPMALAASL